MDATIAIATVMTVLGVWTAIVVYGFCRFWADCQNSKSDMRDKKLKK